MSHLLHRNMKMAFCKNTTPLSWNMNYYVFGDTLCLRFTSYHIRRHGGCCAEVGYRPQTKISNLKANIFVDCYSSCSSY